MSVSNLLSDERVSELDTAVHFEAAKLLSPKRKSTLNSIPKFVAFDEKGDPLMIWGPQPDAIRTIRRDLMDGGEEGSVVSSTTVDWCAEEGWLEVERELTELIDA